METKTFRSSIGTSDPARQECVRTKFTEQQNQMCKLLTVFLAQQSWAKKSLTLLLKIQDVSRHPDTVAAVKIHSYVTAYGIFLHLHIMHLSLAG